MCKNFAMPNLKCLVNFDNITPITTVNVERNYSTMNRIKIKYRNKLRDDLLMSLTLIKLNGPE